MKVKFLLLFILLTKLSFAQCDLYYKLNSSGGLESSPALTDAVKWPNYFNIKTSEDFSWVPSYLSNVQNRFDDAVSAWQNALNQEGWYLTIFQNQGDGIKIFFTDTTMYFDDPINEFAISTQCVAGGEFVDSCSNNDAQHWDGILHHYVTRGRIVFNGTSQFGTDKFSSESCFAVPSDKYSFTYVAMHELGHMLGFPHCNINPSFLMYPQMELGPNVCSIGSQDVTWFLNLIYQGPITKLYLNQFLNRDNYFFNYQPKVLFYIYSEAINKEKPNKTGYPQNTENKLFTTPKPEAYRVELKK